VHLGNKRTAYCTIMHVSGPQHLTDANGVGGSLPGWTDAQTTSFSSVGSFIIIFNQLNSM
jgi:hypothetical protein